MMALLVFSLSGLNWESINSEHLKLYRMPLALSRRNHNPGRLTKHMKTIVFDEITKQIRLFHTVIKNK